MHLQHLHEIIQIWQEKINNNNTKKDAHNGHLCRSTYISGKIQSIDVITLCDELCKLQVEPLTATLAQRWGQILKILNSVVNFYMFVKMLLLYIITWHQKCFRYDATSSYVRFR